MSLQNVIKIFISHRHVLVAEFFESLLRIWLWPQISLFQSHFSNKNHGGRLQGHLHLNTPQWMQIVGAVPRADQDPGSVPHLLPPAVPGHDMGWDDRIPHTKILECASSEAMFIHHLLLWTPLDLDGSLRWTEMDLISHKLWTCPHRWILSPTNCALAEGTRPRRGPKNRWKDRLKRSLKACRGKHAFIPQANVKQMKFGKIAVEHDRLAPSHLMVLRPWQHTVSNGDDWW